MTPPDPRSAIDPRLYALVAAPFSRALYLGRVRSLVVRYERVLAIDAGALAAEEVSRLELSLLREHPSALLERTAVPPPVLAARLEAARQEEVNLRAAAPLPAPLDRTDRTTVLAVADVEWLMREVRLIRRALRRRPPDMIRDRYPAFGRSDPIPDLTSELIRAVASVPRGGLFRACCEIAAARHGVIALGAMIAPDRPRAGPLTCGRVFVCEEAELVEGVGRSVEAEGRRIAVFRSGGELHALDDSCPHRGGPLHQGDLENGAVICPLHGWAFDLRTGKMRGNPRIAVEVFEVEREGGDLFVAPGKKAPGGGG